MFLAVDCPISNRYVPELRRLAAAYRAKGVDWLAVFPDRTLTEDKLKNWAKDYLVDFPYALDPKGAETKRAQATVTPEAAVYAGGKLVYRGRIDDRYSGWGQSRPEPDRRDVVEALEACLAGAVPAFRSTKSWGCFIETGERR